MARKMDLKRLSELLKAGLSSREIAKQLGVSEVTVWYWKKKLGLRVHASRRWSREEDEIIVENYPAMGVAGLKAFLPNRTCHAIEHRIRFLRKQGLLKVKRRKQKVEREKFVELWNKGVSVDEIAKFFDISKAYVHQLRRRLGLEGRVSAGKREAALKVLKVLEESGGYCEFGKLVQYASKYLINQLVEKGAVYKVSFKGKSRKGRRRHVSLYQLVKSEYARKTYICSSRTAVVRLLSHVLRSPENSGVVRATTIFLKSLGLTAAETEAVLYMLKKRSYGKLI